MQERKKRDIARSEQEKRLSIWRRRRRSDGHIGKYVSTVTVKEELQNKSGTVAKLIDSVC